MTNQYLGITILTSLLISLTPLTATAVILPQSLKVDQLHRQYTDVQHRYQLTVKGRDLAGSDVSFQWQTDCGKFYEQQTGPSLDTTATRGPGTDTPQWIVWGYDLPKDCSAATVSVAVQKGTDIGYVLKQKVFSPKDLLTVEQYQPKHPSEERKVPVLRRINIRIGLFWGWLGDLIRGRPDDATRDQAPSGSGAIRN